MSSIAFCGSRTSRRVLVHGASTASLVHSLSAASSQSAHAMALEVFSRWYDLGTQKKGEKQHITVVDESNNVFKDADINRIDSRYSSVFWFPADQEQLTNALIA